MNQQVHSSQNPQQQQLLKNTQEQQQPDTFIYEPPTQQQYQYKIYINDCDRYLPSQLVETFRNDHLIQANPNIIVSSRSQLSLQREKKLRQKMKNDLKSKKEKWEKNVQLLKIKVQKEQQSEQQPKAQQNLQPKQQQQIIQRAQIQIPAEPQAEPFPQFYPPDGVDSLIDITNQRLYNSILLKADIILFQLRTDNIQEFEYILKFLKNADLEKEKKIICVSTFLSWGLRRNGKFPLVISSQDLTARNPINFHLKQLQNLCLALHHQNSLLKGTVVFSGIAYGLGQDHLFAYFKRALQQEKPLEVYGNGTNILPLIHVQDLCSIIYNTVFSNFDQRKNWHFACDDSKITQKQLIQCIANSLGNGNIQAKPIEECFHKQNFDLMTLDLEVTQKVSVEQWCCKGGLIQNIEKVVSQFNDYRGLKANKILIIGPPVSGKTTIAQTLQKNYGLPLINIQKLIEDIKTDQSDFGREIQSLLAELKIQKIEEEKKIYEQMKKKKKGKGVEEFDPDKVVPRLPEDQLVRVVKWRLNASDCQNKGYILDSVIKSFDLAQQVFTGENNQIIQTILPNSVFLVKGTQQQVKQRVKSIPPEKAQNTHWTQEQTTRRYLAYLKNIQTSPVLDFFEGKVDIKQVEMNYADPQIFSEFVERNGPLGFKKQIQDQHLTENIEEQQKEDEQKDSQQEQEQEEEEEQQPQEVEHEQFNLQKLTQKQQKILNQKSRPIRQYLIDNVIPQITEGLLEICKDVPEDPIDFLIEFLQSKNSKEKAKS